MYFRQFTFDYLCCQYRRQDFAWVGVSVGSVSVKWGPGGIFSREIWKNRVVEVHISCILTVIRT